MEAVCGRKTARLSVITRPSRRAQSPRPHYIGDYASRGRAHWPLRTRPGSALPSLQRSGRKATRPTDGPAVVTVVLGVRGLVPLVVPAVALSLGDELVQRRPAWKDTPEPRPQTVLPRRPSSPRHRARMPPVRVRHVIAVSATRGSPEFSP